MGFMFAVEVYGGNWCNICLPKYTLNTANYARNTIIYFEDELYSSVHGGYSCWTSSPLIVELN